MATREGQLKWRSPLKIGIEVCALVGLVILALAMLKASESQSRRVDEGVLHEAVRRLHIVQPIIDGLTVNQATPAKSEFSDSCEFEDSFVSRIPGITNSWSLDGVTSEDALSSLRQQLLAAGFKDGDDWGGANYPFRGHHYTKVVDGSTIEVSVSVENGKESEVFLEVSDLSDVPCGVAG